jgi:drug/metabolite transporter (DMT)-like permease
VAVFSIGAQLSINQALVRIPAQKVSVMMTAEVPLVTAFGVLFLGEPSGWRVIVGALMIFGSGIGLNLLPDRSTSNYSNRLEVVSEPQIRSKGKAQAGEKAQHTR